MLHITHSLSSIFISRCRHATISQFFGNQKPDCAGACDFCRDPGLVRAQLARAAALSTRTGPAQSAEPRGPFGFDPELYAGGRKGYGFERSADLLLKQLCCMIRAVSLWRLRACVCVCSDVMRNGAMRKMTLRRGRKISEISSRNRWGWERWAHGQGTH